MSKYSKKQLKNSLVNLGLSPTETAVYVALLDIGSTGAGAIIEKTGLHRNVVYTALSHLVASKLASERVVRGRKHFSPKSLEVLSETFSHKAAKANELAGIIAKQLPQDIAVSVHQGNEEYLALLTSLLKALPKGATKYVLGTGGSEFMEQTMLPIWKPYHDVAKARKIQIRMIGYNPQREVLRTALDKEKVYDVRYLSEDIENPVGVHIYPEAGVVLNIIYSNQATPVTAISITHPELVQGYLSLFENLWSKGKV